MKRTLTLILTVLMLCTLLFGCGQKSGDGDPQDTNTEPALADGVYTADFSTDSSMFHVNEACEGKGTLTVENGQMTIHISLPSKSILNLFCGTAEDARKDGAALLQPTTDTVTYSDGLSEEVNGFDIPVPALDEEFDVAIIGTKGKWYDHKVSVSNPVPVEESGKTVDDLALADGTYTASEQGCLSEVAVTVTVTGGKVTNVAIDASGETPELGGAAAETLADELTKAGSTAGVDAVSGATLTSNAVFTAMDSCLAQAGTGSAGAEDLTDGTYTSSAKGCLSDVEVTVTVSGGKVSEVAIDASGETPELGGAAAETLADALTKAGSTNGVDAVSGATLTSEAVFTAMNDCLSQAQ